MFKRKRTLLNIRLPVRSLRSTAWRTCLTSMIYLRLTLVVDWQRGLDRPTKAAAASVCAESSSWELRSLGASPG